MNISLKTKLPLMRHPQAGQNNLRSLSPAPIFLLSPRSLPLRSPHPHLISVVSVVDKRRQGLAKLDVNEERGQLQDVGEGGLKVCLVEAPSGELLEQTRVGFVGSGDGFTLHHKEGLALAGGEGGREEGVVGSKAGGRGLNRGPCGWRGGDGGGRS